MNKHAEDAAIIIKYAIAECDSDSMRGLNRVDVDAMVEYIVGPYRAIIDRASEALETIIVAAQEEAVGSVVSAIRQAEGIDPFVVDSAVETWLGARKEQS